MNREKRPAASKELEDITCLYEVTRVLASSKDLRASLAHIMEVLSSLKNMHNGTVTIINPLTGQLEIEVAHGMPAEARKRGKYKVGEGITGRVVATGQPIVIPHIGAESDFLNRTRTRGDISKQQNSFLCVPIRHDKRSLGALSIDLEYREDLNYEEELRFLAIVSGLIAQAVLRVQAEKEDKERLTRENIELKNELSEKYRVGNIIGNSSRMQEMFEMLHRVSDSNATVLLRGESGTGKTLVARALHYNSSRVRKPFIVVNCSALPETLLESELFGHEKGAFTGAHAMKKGRFEVAEGGTLFLDEIGELSQAVQVKLLQVVQDREFQRLGGVAPLKCNVRLVAATNRDLEKAVAEKHFREDLYYRLNVFPIYLPPLRERRTDILLLTEYFLKKYNEENSKEIRRISTPAIDMLLQYHWPGNVRELQNCIERAVLICDEESIKSYHLPPSLQTSESVNSKKALSLAGAVENFERELIVEALKRAGGNQTRAARELDTSLRIINYKIHRYSIDPKKFKVKK
ncbi:MAG: sigma 54-interacting transcriptional regulator [Deltaproteobacteria bacterium]|jgi:Nif-specific regulatory protein|nr:sigma 54-interacting transcriptional regulator [Deltaproteobacteria bacterium]